jgi:hypothetical protein
VTESDHDGDDKGDRVGDKGNESEFGYGRNN